MEMTAVLLSTIPILKKNSLIWNEMLIIWFLKVYIFDKEGKFFFCFFLNLYYGVDSRLYNQLERHVTIMEAPKQSV